MHLQCKMYPCGQCNKSYMWSSDLHRHMKNKHMSAPSSTVAVPAGYHLSTKPLVFQHPFTMTVSGPTGSGKTYFIKSLLEHDKIAPSPARIVYLYKRWQPLYDAMKETLDIEFIKGIPDTLDDDAFFDVNIPNLLIIDDMMGLASQDPKIADLFTEGSHHRNLTVINLTQNLFPQGRNSVTQRRNTHYMVIFKSPTSQDQIRTLASFMFPGKVCQFLDTYQEATSKPHGYLVIDSKQNTPDDERLKTNIFDTHETPKTENNTQKDNTAKTPFFDMTLDRLRYHAPYVRWMMNPKANPPENWECYLDDMLGDDLEGIDNPKALAHLAQAHEKDFGNNVRRYCEDCNDNVLRGCWFSKCPQCEQVHIYPKHGWIHQELNCEACQYSFHTRDDTCRHIVAYCPKCQKAWVTNPNFKTSKRGYVKYTELNL